MGWQQELVDDGAKDRGWRPGAVARDRGCNVVDVGSVLKRQQQTTAAWRAMAFDALAEFAAIDERISPGPVVMKPQPQQSGDQSHPIRSRMSRLDDAGSIRRSDMSRHRCDLRLARAALLNLQRAGDLTNAGDQFGGLNCPSIPSAAIIRRDELA
ncbi:hypothetical protein [Bradyrhizobium sp. sGM-13]|uniref:hypothetical protein n=1 Tax=Bradyrhizobium sp. sGM-13 TaxID=2831781 RepID=UPI001BCD4254|nr:hypothetical protein [Bradyrhizobium sp. sGM-13]